MGANSPKYRDYMITINQGAPCYENALEIVKEMNTKLYGLIVHDKDIEITTNEDGEAITKPKKTHKHIVIECKNPVSFQAMQKRFEGAHIETIKYKKSAYQYLIHNSLNSKEKYQYATDEIVSNDLQAVKFAIETETYEIFKENNWLRYIAEGTRTPYQFTKRFGLNVYKQYWKPYSDMLENINQDEEMQNDLENMKRDLENASPF
jgi:hypothetical protein